MDMQRSFPLSVYSLKKNLKSKALAMVFAQNTGKRVINLRSTAVRCYNIYTYIIMSLSSKDEVDFDSILQRLSLHDIGLTTLLSQQPDLWQKFLGVFRAPTQNALWLSYSIPQKGSKRNLQGTIYRLDRGRSRVKLDCILQRAKLGNIDLTISLSQQPDQCFPASSHGRHSKWLRLELHQEGSKGEQWPRYGPYHGLSLCIGHFITLQAIPYYRGCLFSCLAQQSSYNSTNYGPVCTSLPRYFVHVQVRDSAARLWPHYTSNDYFTANDVPFRSTKRTTT